MLWSAKHKLPIPSQLAGMRVKIIGHQLHVTLEGVGVSVLWDLNKMVTVEATASLWNRTAGLCGTMDEDVQNEFLSKDGSKHKVIHFVVVVLLFGKKCYCSALLL